MPTYTVAGTLTIGVELTVEAESAEEALEQAGDYGIALQDYVGNGATYGKLIGTSDPRVTLGTNADGPEFPEAFLAEGQ